jgi:hypothetical protein
MTDQLDLGLELRDEGMAMAEAAATDWKIAWRIAIEELAASSSFDGQPRRFSADDVRVRAGEPEDHVNAVGSLFCQAARAGLIEAVGVTKSRRATRHANRVVVWQGVRP